MSDSLRPHGLQHARLPCPSPTPRACSNSCPSSRWCHPTISSSAIPFSPAFIFFPSIIEESKDGRKEKRMEEREKWEKKREGKDGKKGERKEERKKEGEGRKKKGRKEERKIHLSDKCHERNYKAWLGNKCLVVLTALVLQMVFSKAQIKKRKKKSMYNEQSLIVTNSILRPMGVDTIADITKSPGRSWSPDVRNDTPPISVNPSCLFGQVEHSPLQIPLSSDFLHLSFPAHRIMRKSSKLGII